MQIESCCFFVQSGFSQDEMFEYFNCGIDYLLIVDHTKISVESIVKQLTEENCSCFSVGNFQAISKKSR